MAYFKITILIAYVIRINEIKFVPYLSIIEERAS